jgi:hypothetical protein
MAISDHSEYEIRKAIELQQDVVRRALADLLKLQNHVEVHAFAVATIDQLR